VLQCTPTQHNNNNNKKGTAIRNWVPKLNQRLRQDVSKGKSYDRMKRWFRKKENSGITTVLISMYLEIGTEFETCFILQNILSP
jgi:hypothetical protein